MAEDSGGTKAITRLLTAGIGALMLAWGYHYRQMGVTDPVAAVRIVAARFPVLRADIGIDQLGTPCETGDLAACVDLGQSYANVRDGGPPMPRCLDHALFARACDGGEWRGCVEVARTSRRGDCGRADLARARSVLDAACARLVFAACDAKADL